MLPAPGQGALAVECNEAREDLVALLGSVDDPLSRAATTAERSLLGGLLAGCAAPVGAYAAGTEELSLRGVVVAADGGRALRSSASGPLATAELIGRRVAADLLGMGAASVMAVSGGHLTSGDDDK
jgi:hydroxymethylbilane synthase